MVKKSLIIRRNRKLKMKIPTDVARTARNKEQFFVLARVKVCLLIISLGKILLFYPNQKSQAIHQTTH